AQGAGMKKVPILVREGLRSEAERLELALIENVQREDLNPIERATACRTLMADFGLSQQEVAEGLGYERSTIANLVRLLELPDEIQVGVSRETISAGHARALLRVADPALQAAVYQRIQAEGLSVRKAETLAAAAAKGKLTPAHRPRPRQAAWVTQLQEKLTRAVGSRAEIRTRRGGGGRLVFHFQDLDELDRLTQGFALPGEAEELLGSN
ncbi:MAG: ParB/RepB/Spo0J family partition protein, partial [Planctomycetes bacterium]|nr:ParB/RepB/Spo0J family partition protein [Planctomycetota bacterium]